MFTCCRNFCRNCFISYRLMFIQFRFSKIGTFTIFREKFIFLQTLIPFHFNSI